MPRQNVQRAKVCVSHRGADAGTDRYREMSVFTSGREASPMRFPVFYKGKKFYFQIDLEDFDRVLDHKWHLAYSQKNDSYYVNMGNGNGKIKSLALARFLMNAPKGTHVDHNNHDTLDNRKENLLVCTPSRNILNQIPHNGRQMVGVYWDKRIDKWQSKIRIKGTQVFLGNFESFEAAAKVRMRVLEDAMNGVPTELLHPKMEKEKIEWLENQNQ